MTYKKYGKNHSYRKGGYGKSYDGHSYKKYNLYKGGYSSNKGCSRYKGIGNSNNYGNSYSSFNSSLNKLNEIADLSNALGCPMGSSFNSSLNRMNELHQKIELINLVKGLL